MLRKIKLSIAQSLSLIAMIGALIFLATANIDEPLWRDDILAYHPPPVPIAFELVPDKPIVATHNSKTGKSTFNFADGRTLYLENHLQGWCQLRRSFYDHQDWGEDVEKFDFYDDYDYSKLNFRNPYELVSLARWEGARRCREQIQDLLQDYNENELRARLALSPLWATAPTLVVFSLAAMLFLLSLRQTRKAVSPRGVDGIESAPAHQQT